eukprot:TRINITY_DN16224_c0_g1_i1.p1 TRINITY_DN16224_c0_g1~~TRINITY_DN16224_c0_g1_i1.p1  ORF type:complete len:199 (+),score=31.07 TRINITY_DN16224_c0_g1_i1:28-597(+)
MTPFGLKVLGLLVVLLGIAWRVECRECKGTLYTYNKRGCFSSAQVGSGTVLSGTGGGCDSTGNYQFSDGCLYLYTPCKAKDQKRYSSACTNHDDISVKKSWKWRNGDYPKSSSSNTGSGSTTGTGSISAGPPPYENTDPNNENNQYTPPPPPAGGSSSSGGDGKSSTAGAIRSAPLLLVSLIVVLFRLF